MDLKSDLPFWTVCNGLLTVYPPLTDDVRCDALVIGGGITGAILADSLVQAGADTVVVDRRDIGHGSTSASTALLQYEIDEPLHRLREKAGRKFADRAYLMGARSVNRLARLAGKNCDFVSVPSVFLAKVKGDEPFLRREYEARREAGLAVRLLGRTELRREFGVNRWAGLVSEVGASLDPYRLTHSLLNRWRGKGLRVFDRTEVKRYRANTTGVDAFTDRGSRIRCRRVFFATGFETQEILPRTFVQLRSTYALVSEPLKMPWWRKNCLLWEKGDAYLYARQTADGRVLAGGEDDFVLSGPRRDAQTEGKAVKIRRKFERLFPGSRIEPAFWWSGVFGSTKDGLPYIGPHPDFPRGYFALGFGGNGITFSVMAARILTDLFLARANPDAEIYRFDR